MRRFWSSFRANESLIGLWRGHWTRLKFEIMLNAYETCNFLNFKNSNKWKRNTDSIIRHALYVWPLKKLEIRHQQAIRYIRGCFKMNNCGCIMFRFLYFDFVDLARLEIIHKDNNIKIDNSRKIQFFRCCRIKIVNCQL